MGKKRNSSRERRQSTGDAGKHPGSNTTLDRVVTDEAIKDFGEILTVSFGSSSDEEKSFTRANGILATALDSWAPTTDDDKIRFLAAIAKSVRTLDGYATLHYPLVRKIRSLIEAIEEYIADRSKRRPFNILMFAAPGAGKSHLIRCIATRLKSANVDAITFNMATQQSNDDFVPPLDAARNLKVKDRVPLLFLDEFDSKPANNAILLPLLWDGGLSIGQRDLMLGKVVIVLAGSDPALPDAMESAKAMRTNMGSRSNHDGKHIVLFSRINGGVLAIPKFLETSDPQKPVDRTLDKICAAIQIMRYRFEGRLRAVPRFFLRFIHRAEFRYDVRSIQNLVDLIPFREDCEVLEVGQLDRLPFSDVNALRNSPLAYHLLDDEDQAHGIIRLWEECRTDDKNGIDNDLLPVWSRSVESLMSWPEFDPRAVSWFKMQLAEEVGSIARSIK